jgi:hypothetical protein
MLTKTLRNVTAILFVAMLFFACKTYYKANAVDPATSAKSVDSLKKSNRYFILRNGDEALYIKDIELSADQKTAQCVLRPLSPEHQTHLTNGIKGKKEYKRTSPVNMEVVNEVHFFIPKDNKAEFGNYTLQLDKVNKIEVLEHDKKRTTNSYVLGAVGYTLGAFATAALIILATKSSCPFVAAYDGNDFSLQGEIYGGSIYPQLSRLDYLPLKMSPMADGTLQLKITNELKERQYTDFARLWRISHSKDSKIMVDEKGNLLSISNPQAPVEAILNGRKNVVASLNKASDFNLIYMDDSSQVNARNEITMKFKKPAGGNKGKLVLSLKNSYFLDLLYGELAKGFGTFYASYMNEQKKKSKEELLKWVKEQQLPLDVSVNTERGWQNTTSITTIGPLAFRETAIEVDLSNVKTDEVEIKLGSGFMFWEIDYAAMDFSTDKNFNVEKLDPESATDETGKNVLPELINEDGQYLDQPSIGNSATIVFRSKSTGNASSAQTFILETKGYYEHIRDFKNKPDIKFLEQFKKPGAFPVYGMGLYKKIKKESLEGFAKSN